MKRRKILSVLLAVLMLITASFATISANAAQSGTCGDNLTWTLDDAGVLTISGTGKMQEYKLFQTPWRSLSGVKEIIIEEGVTSISGNSFYDMIPERISISSTVETIGDKAFPKFSSILLDKNNKYFVHDESGVLYDKNKTKIFWFE